MAFLQKIISTIGFTLLMSVFVFAQEDKPNLTKKITVCRFETRMAAANFRTYYSYYVDVARNGKVSNITDSFGNIQRKRKHNFVRDELFVDCMKEWQLEPAGRYIVEFYVGTNSGRNYMRISDPNKEVLEVDLAICDSETQNYNEIQKNSESFSVDNTEQIIGAKADSRTFMMRDLLLISSRPASLNSRVRWFRGFPKALKMQKRLCEIKLNE